VGRFIFASSPMIMDFTDRLKTADALKIIVLWSLDKDIEILIGEGKKARFACELFLGVRKRLLPDEEIAYYQDEAIDELNEEGVINQDKLAAKNILLLTEVVNTGSNMVNLWRKMRTMFPKSIFNTVSLFINSREIFNVNTVFSSRGFQLDVFGRKELWEPYTSEWIMAAPKIKQEFPEDYNTTLAAVINEVYEELKEGSSKSYIASSPAMREWGLLIGGGVGVYFKLKGNDVAAQWIVGGVFAAMYLWEVLTARPGSDDHEKIYAMYWQSPSRLLSHGKFVVNTAYRNASELPPGGLKASFTISCFGDLVRILSKHHEANERKAVRLNELIIDGHGNVARLAMAQDRSAVLNIQTLKDDEVVSNHLAEIGSYLEPGSTVFIYSCLVGRGQRGNEFMRLFAEKIFGDKPGRVMAYTTVTQTAVLKRKKIYHHDPQGRSYFTMSFADKVIDGIERVSRSSSPVESVDVLISKVQKAMLPLGDQNGSWKPFDTIVRQLKERDNVNIRVLAGPHAGKFIPKTTNESLHSLSWLKHHFVAHPRILSRGSCFIRDGSFSEEQRWFLQFALENIIQHVKTGIAVVIRYQKMTARGPNYIRLSVIDNGRGFGKFLIQKAIVDGSTSDHKNGQGIGLTVAVREYAPVSVIRTAKQGAILKWDEIESALFEDQFYFYKNDTQTFGTSVSAYYPVDFLCKKQMRGWGQGITKMLKRTMESPASSPVSAFGQSPAPTDRVEWVSLASYYLMRYPSCSKITSRLLMRSGVNPGRKSLRALMIRAAMGGCILIRIIPGYCCGGYINMSAKWWSWVSMILPDSWAILAMAVSFEPGGTDIISWPFDFRKATTSLRTFSSTRNRILADSGERNIIAGFDYFSRIVEGCLNMLFGELRIGIFDNILRQFAGFQHLQDKVYHNPRFFKTRLAMAYGRIDSYVISVMNHFCLFLKKEYSLFLRRSQGLIVSNAITQGHNNQDTSSPVVWHETVSTAGVDERFKSYNRQTGQQDNWLTKRASSPALIRLERNNLFTAVEGNDESVKNIFLTKEIKISSEVGRKSNCGFKADISNLNRQFVQINRDKSSVANHRVSNFSFSVIQPQIRGDRSKENRRARAAVNIGLRFKRPTGPLKSDLDNGVEASPIRFEGEYNFRLHRIWLNSSGAGTGRERGVSFGNRCRAFLTASLPRKTSPPQITILRRGYFLTRASKFSLTNMSLSKVFFMDLTFLTVTPSITSSLADVKIDSFDFNRQTGKLDNRITRYASSPVVWHETVSTAGVDKQFKSYNRQTGKQDNWLTKRASSPIENMKYPLEFSDEFIQFINHCHDIADHDLTLRISSGCGYGCIHCLVDSQQASMRHMPMEHIEKIVSALQGKIQKLRIDYDNDPLQHPDIVRILEGLKRSRIGLDQFFTKGWGSDDEKTRRRAEEIAENNLASVTLSYNFFDKTAVKRLSRVQLDSRISIRNALDGYFEFYREIVGVLYPVLSDINKLRVLNDYEPKEPTKKLFILQELLWNRLALEFDRTGMDITRLKGNNYLLPIGRARGMFNKKYLDPVSLSAFVIGPDNSFFFSVDKVFASCFKNEIRDLNPVDLLPRLYDRIQWEGIFEFAIPVFATAELGSLSSRSLIKLGNIFKVSDHASSPVKAGYWHGDSAGFSKNNELKEMFERFIKERRLIERLNE
jgi:hypothetical protein